MLRRQATKITLNQDDIVAYDARKAQKDQQKQQVKYGNLDLSANKLSESMGPPRKDTRTKDQRLGLSRN